jgi:hypothetical protein
MDELVRWLGEQLDDDERIARALVDDKRPGRADPWEFCDDGSIRDTSRHGSLRVKFTWAPEAEHIIRHDPARVLREIDAKRQILRQAFEHAATIDGEWGCCHDADEIEAGHCEEQRPNDLRLLRLLALPYAGRPGYREEWAP